MTKDKKKGNNN